MSANNRAQLRGRLARDIQKFENKNGSQTWVFTLAVKKDYVKDGEDKVFYQPVYHYVKAENVDKENKRFMYTKKGSDVLVATRVEVNTFEKEGVRVSDIRLRLEEIEFLESKKTVEERQA